MVGQSMNVELDRTLKEAAVVYSRFYPGIFMEVLTKTANIFSQDIPRSVRANPLYPNRNLQRYLHTNLN
jgi:hypothetical protein